jgi:uncharacterized protein (UPF0332 family)
MNDIERSELVQYRIERANDTFQEVENHIKNGYLNTAVNRLYYACYYAVIALLVKNGIQTQTHAGARQMFGMHFVKTGLIRPESGKFFSEIFDFRQAGDYDDYISIAKEDILELIEPAHKLISQIELLLKQ